jgi:hypothetical protein
MRDPGTHGASAPDSFGERGALRATRQDRGTDDQAKPVIVREILVCRIWRAVALRRGGTKMLLRSLALGLLLLLPRTPAAQRSRAPTR